MIYPFTIILPLFNKKVKKFINIRKIDKKKIESFLLNSENKKVIWLHAASVGELDQCKALASEILSREPETLLIQSTFSDSVNEKSLENIQSIIHFKLPLDFYFSYNFIFEKFSPQALILMAWDTWPNLILAAKKHNCKVYLSCATINKKSGRNNFLIRNLTQSVFQKIDGISPCHKIFLKEFKRITKGNVNIQVCGDSRFDAVVEKIQTQKPSEKFIKFTEKFNSYTPIILGSTYLECEDVIFPTIPELLTSFNCTIWIFPHKVHAERIQNIQKSLEEVGIEYMIYSKLSSNEKIKRVVVMDELGLLAFAYEHSVITYIGGALHNRVHNVIEPAYFGNPILAGPKIHNSAEALVLKKIGGLFQIQSVENTKQTIKQLLADPFLLDQIKKQNHEFVIQNLNASKRFYDEFLAK